VCFRLLNKYQLMFLQQLEQTTTAWLQAGQRAATIPHREVYRLLHSVRGTAGTIGLPRFSEVAGELLQQLEEESDRQWPQEELGAYLRGLLSLADETKAGGYPAEEAGIAVLPAAKASDAVREAVREKEHVILLIDDDAALLQLIKDALEAEGWMVVTATDGEQAIRLFFEMRPDCVMLDAVLGDTSGFEIMDTIREQALVSFVPIVMMSGKNDKATRIRCYEGGGDDFCPKPVDLEELVPRLRRLLVRRQQLKQLLLRDPLTGAYTLGFYPMEMKRRVTAEASGGQPFALLCADVDGFADVNDTYGHMHGNRLLKQFVQLAEEIGGSGSVLFRDYGDRFYILTGFSGEERGKQLAEALVNRMAQSRLQTSKGTFSRTLSVGVAEIRPSGEAPEVWLERAKAALQQAKREGGNTVRSFETQQAVAVKQTAIKLAIIDDDPLLCKLLARQLRDIGGADVQIDLRVYADGELFFEDPWHNQPGSYLIVLDKLMPKMNGMEVLRRLRAHYDRRRYKILMLTGVDADQDVVTALEEGTDDYLTKPFSLPELEARIRRFIRGIVK
jgi:two-component system, cell cycle response regulator